MTEIDLNQVRPTLYGNRQAVSSTHYLASAAGFAVLEGGGNAVDAACCAGIALTVLHSEEVNFAGVAPIMIRMADGRTVTIDGLGYWPKAIPADLFMREHDGKFPLGVLRTVVPAGPDAWITALRDFGTMSFADVAGAAIEFAREGFAAFPTQVAWLNHYETSYKQWDTNAAIYMPGGRPPKVGDRFVQTDLAGLMQFMADEDRAHAGKGRVAGLTAARDAFYIGDIARRITDYHAEHGGYLTRADMAQFHCRYEEPLHTRWRDCDVITCGPWCQGPLLAQSLLMIERAGLGGLKHNSADYIHLVTEILKAAFADREYRYGDPLFVDVGLAELMSAEHIGARVAAIDPKRAMPDMPGPLGRPGHSVAAASSGEAAGRIEPDTAFVCTIDRWGNAVSATPSDPSWRSPVIPGLGIVPSPRGTQSRPDPRHPSGIAPGKRPRLTPNPAMILRDDGSIMPIGAPGGDSQTQAMLQVALNVLHFGMDVQEAILAPRFITHSFPSSFAPFAHHPGLLNVESRIPQAVVSDLEARGHKMNVWSAFDPRTATVEAILRDTGTKFIRAGADPRKPSSAIVL